MSNITNRNIIFWKVRDIILSELQKLKQGGKLIASDDQVVQAGSAIMRALGFDKEELELMGEVSLNWRAPDQPETKP